MEGKVSASFLKYSMRPDSDGRLRRPSSGRKKQKISITLGLWRFHATAPGPDSKKFFGSFFLKKNRFLAYSAAAVA
jgi:hypothetical protein